MEDNRLRVAIVDDVRAECERLRDRLSAYAGARGLAWELRCFSGGREFLAAAEREQFSLVFLDIVMEDMDGLETARRLRLADGDVPVVFVTGCGLQTGTCPSSSSPQRPATPWRATRWRPRAFW